MFRRLGRRLKQFALRRPPPPPLPIHVVRGLRVVKGDKLTITDMTISLDDLGDQAGHDEPYHFALPDGNAEFESGGVFALDRPVEIGRFQVDGNLVHGGLSGRTIHVLLRSQAGDPFRTTYRIADRVLDLVSVESFRRAALKSPLRMHAVWFRENGALVFRYTTTGRLGLRMRTKAEVRTPEGKIREQGPYPPVAWHPSFAYFRRSQLTDELDDAYRYLFLALEALLSTAYPRHQGQGERRWLRDALEYVVEGYGLSLREFVGGEGGNPYRRFMKEQYQARRCALFHAKLHEGPTLPGDLMSRAALVAATDNLGRLYVRLAQHLTGVKFGGGAMSDAGVARLMEAYKNHRLFLAPQMEGEGGRMVDAPPQLDRVEGQASVYQQVARWESGLLDGHRIRRVGSLMWHDERWVEAFWDDVDIDVGGADYVELVVRTELENSEHLRAWFL